MKQQLPRTPALAANASAGASRRSLAVDLFGNSLIRLPADRFYSTCPLHDCQVPRVIDAFAPCGPASIICFVPADEICA
jgi:hypothetical protein